MLLIILFYLKLIFAAICGQAINLIKKNKAMSAKAKTSQVSYEGFWKFVREDAISIWGTAFTIAFILLLIGEGANSDAIIVNNRTFTWWIFEFSAKAILNMVFISLMGTVGYVGMDIALAIFSVTNKKVNKAISQAPSVNTDI